MRVYIEQTTKQGRYLVRQDTPQGAILCKASRQPLLDASRALLRKGITGKVEMWDSVRPYPRLMADIASAAKLMVVDSDRDGLRFVPWTPFPTPRARPNSSI